MAMTRKIVILLGLLAVFLLPLVPAALAQPLARPASAGEGYRGAPPQPIAVAAPSGIVRNYPGGSPCNATLQACLSGSDPGDVINVAANTYITGLLVITKAVVLQGAGGSPASTVLRPDGSHGVIDVGTNIAAGVVISNLSVFSGTAANGAGILGGSGSPLTVQNVDIMSNTATSNGGGIFAGAHVTLNNVNFVNNKANAGVGGGVRANSTALVNSGRFERNSTANGGGAIQANGALTLSNVIVISNTSTSASFSGGGMRADGGLFMLGGLVQNNVSGNDGGGISASSAVISASQIISNAGDDGGGVHVSGALSVTNAFFNKNVARTGNGGSIYSQNSAITITLNGTSSVSKTTISNSSAITHGGGIYAAGGVHLLGYLTFSNNKALSGEGGAIYTGDNVDDDFPNAVTKLWTGNTSAGYVYGTRVSK